MQAYSYKFKVFTDGFRTWHKHTLGQCTTVGEREHWGTCNAKMQLQS